MHYIHVAYGNKKALWKHTQLHISEICLFIHASFINPVYSKTIVIITKSLEFLRHDSLTVTYKFNNI